MRPGLIEVRVKIAGILAALNDTGAVEKNLRVGLRGSGGEFLAQPM
jgi:hypothetical protein